MGAANPSDPAPLLVAAALVMPMRICLRGIRTYGTGASKLLKPRGGTKADKLRDKAAAENTLSTVADENALVQAVLGGKPTVNLGPILDDFPKDLSKSVGRIHKPPASLRIPKPTSYKILHSRFNEAGLLTRPYTFSLVKRLASLRERGTRGNAAMLQGSRGSGKSILIYQCVVWALLNGWKVLYVPDLVRFVDGSLAYQKSSRGSDTYAHLRGENIILEECALGFGKSMPATLDQAIKQVDLLAVDQVNVLWSRSTYFGLDGRSTIPAQNFDLLWKLGCLLESDTVLSIAATSETDSRFFAPQRFPDSFRDMADPTQLASYNSDTAVRYSISEAKVLTNWFNELGNLGVMQDHPQTLRAGLSKVALKSWMLSNGHPGEFWRTTHAMH